MPTRASLPMKNARRVAPVLQSARWKISKWWMKNQSGSTTANSAVPVSISALPRQSSTGQRPKNGDGTEIHRLLLWIWKNNGGNNTVYCFFKGKNEKHGIKFLMQGFLSESVFSGSALIDCQSSWVFPWPNVTRSPATCAVNGSNRKIKSINKHIAKHRCLALINN